MLFTLIHKPYMLSIKTPTMRSDSRRVSPQLPSALAEKFKGQGFISIDQITLLNHEKIALLLSSAMVATKNNVAYEMHPIKLKLENANIFNDLQLSYRQYALKPLTEGTWE